VNIVFRDLLIFLLLTGVGHNEATQIDWSMIDFAEKTVTVPSEIARFRRGYTVPLSKMVMNILENRYHLRIHSNWVFQSEGDASSCTSDYQYGLAKIRAKYNLYFQMTDLRRTFLAKGARLGIHYLILKALTNQKVDDITVQYIIPNRDRMRHATERISEEFMRLMDMRIGDLSEPKRIEAAEYLECRQLLLPLK
jgi:integrase